MTASPIPDWQIPGKKIQDAISILRSERSRDHLGRFARKPTAREVMIKTLRAAYSPTPECEINSTLTASERAAIMAHYQESSPSAARADTMTRAVCIIVAIASIVAGLAIDGTVFGLLASLPAPKLIAAALGRIV